MNFKGEIVNNKTITSL